MNSSDLVTVSRPLNDARRRTKNRMTKLFTAVVFASLASVVSSECVVFDNVKTNLQGDTGSFGNMFDLVAISGADVRVNQIDFYTDVKTNVTFHLWTKEGTYKGHETDESAWRRIAHGWTFGNGVGVTTPIPRKFLPPFILKAGETHGFVLAMESADIRYDMGTTEGATLKESEHLRITQGNGVAQFPPFPMTGTFYAPRLFNGKISYDALTCDETSIDPSIDPAYNPGAGSPTPEPVVELTYLFALETEDDLQTVFRDIEDAVRNILDTSMTDYNGYGLKNHKDLMDIANMSLDDVMAREYTGPLSQGFSCAGCVLIDIIVKVKHSVSENISPEEIRYFLLLHAGQIENMLKYDYKEYKGPKPADTKKTISLKGVSLDVFHDKDLVDYFERTTKAFLNQQVKVADFARVKITSRGNDDDFSGRNGMNSYNSETLVNDNYRRRDLRDAGPLSDIDDSGNRNREHRFSSVDLGVTITGEYQPPPDINFDEKTQESFQSDGGILVQMLQHDDPTGDFRDLSSITSKDADVEDSGSFPDGDTKIALDDDFADMQSAGATANDKFWNKPEIISVYVIAAILVGGVIFAMWMRAVRTSDSNSDADSKDFSFGGSIYSVLKEKAQTMENLWNGRGAGGRTSPPNNVIVGQGRSSGHPSLFSQPVGEMPIGGRERQRQSFVQTHPINNGSFGNMSNGGARSVYSQHMSNGSMGGSHHGRTTLPIN